MKVFSHQSSVMGHGSCVMGHGSSVISGRLSVIGRQGVRRLVASVCVLLVLLGALSGAAEEKPEEGRIPESKIAAKRMYFDLEKKVDDMMTEHFGGDHAFS